MIRMKVRVPPSADFDGIVREASNTCNVLLPDPTSRSFVVECDSDVKLSKLRHLGCHLIEDRRYSPDAA